MLGPAELRELEEALNEERSDGTRTVVRSPYLTPTFAMGLSLTRVATNGLKRSSLTSRTR